MPTAALSRGLAGVAGDCLVVNLPGSRGGVKDAIAVLEPLLVHAVEQIVGSDHGGDSAMTAGWPATLQHGDVTLRPLRYRDARAWRAVRRRNAAWLRPWEATVPPGGSERPATFRGPRHADAPTRP